MWAIAFVLLGLSVVIHSSARLINNSLQDLNQTGRRVAEALDRLELMEILETEPEEVQSGG